MAAIRVFTAHHPQMVENRVSLPSDAHVERVADFSRPPETIVGYVDKWPPDWVGEVADLEGVVMELRDNPSRSHVTLAVTGLEVASSPEFQKALEVVDETGVTADIIIGPGD